MGHGKGVAAVFHRVTDNGQIARLMGVIVTLAFRIIGLFIALGLIQLDKTVTSLLAGVGVIGLALGFAFQDIAANFMSGIIMALQRPFRVGDQVEVVGQHGRIERMDLRSTTLTTLQGLSILVPNKDIFQNPVVNYTLTAHRRLELPVGVAYDSDLEEVRSVALEAARRVPDRDEARSPEVMFSDFGDSSINLVLRVWLAKSD